MTSKSSASSAPSKPTVRNKATPVVKKGQAPLASASFSNGQDRDEIVRQTAYFLYESRRCEGGHELDDWLQAEALIAKPEQQSSLRTAH